MATTSEDEETTRRVKEAAWQITARGLVLAVTFGFGFFAGWIAWGVGIEGAPALREQTTAQELQIVEKNVDECVLCDLCLEVAPEDGVSIDRLYDH